MLERVLTPAYLLAAACALIAAAVLVAGSLTAFSDSDPVTGNTFATCAKFPGDASVSRLGSWTTGLSHTAAAGNDRLLLFVVGYENSGDPGVSSVSYGGRPLTRAVGAVAGTSTYARVELWYLDEAGIAAASGSSFAVTWGGSTPSQPMYAAATYEGVSQSNPIGDSSGAFTNSSSPNPITTAVSVTSGAMAVGGAISGNSGSYTWNNGWTEGTDQTSGSTTTMSSAEHAATSPATDTASATHSGPNRQAIAAVSLSPVPSAVARVGNWTTGLSHTAAAGTDRLLVFVVGYENSGDPGVSSVSYGGRPLTRAVGAVAGTSTYARVELWYLDETGIAAASGSSFAVSWGGSTPSQPMYAAATYEGVSQCNPIGDSSGAFTNSSSPNPITTAVSVTSGAMAVGGAISGNSGSYTWNNGWTEGTDQTSGSTTTMSSAEHAATSPATDTASATHSGPNRQAIVAAVLNRSLDPAGATPWYDAGWGYRKAITIDSSQVAADLTDFPVLIDLTDAALQQYAQADGDDMLFTADDATTKLSHELEYYDAGSGKLVAWVKIPSLSGSADTTIYLYFGNPSAANQENAAAVWSNGFVMVQHLEEASGSGNFLLDSSANGNHGAPLGTTPQFNSTSHMDGGYTFTGNNQQRVEIPDSASLRPTTLLSVGAWAKGASWTSPDHNPVLWKGSQIGWGANYLFRIAVNSGAATWGVTCGTTEGWFAGGAVSPGVWHYYSLTFDGATARAYIDGVEVGSSTACSGLSLNGMSGYPVRSGFGYRSTASEETHFDGDVDELRMSDVARGPTWIQTEFNNQDSPVTFYSVGSLESQ